MNQDDIYNLLLLLLLLSNERDNDDTSMSTRGSLNELILASMLLNSCSTREGIDANGTCPRRNSGNTTF